MATVKALQRPRRFFDRRSPASAVLVMILAFHAGRVTAQESTGGWWESAKAGSRKASNFIMGREQENVVRAKGLYRQGDEIFRAAAASRSTAADDSNGQVKEFKRAAKLFKRAAQAAPGSALAQDASFMQAESLFFADQLDLAADVYQQLQKDHPRNRHSDRVAARLFSITRYWIDTEKATDSKWFTLNLFDPKRPTFDVDGHAVRVLDSIRYDDPTGRLADDATMAAAAEYIREEKFQSADEFLTDLRDTFPESEHFFLAHLLGIRCKMELYAGPQYSNLMLEEADKLIRQTRERFPDKLAETEYGEMVARAAAEVAYRRAEHLFVRAQYREKRGENGAAEDYYQQVVDNYPGTPFEAPARDGLQRVAGLQRVPERYFTWLTKVFPDSKKTEPLVPTFQTAPQASRDTVMR